MLRAKDGKFLAQKLRLDGLQLAHPAQRNGVTASAARPCAVRLPESVENVEKPMKIKPLWKGKATGGGYWFSSPVVHDGLLYAASDQGVLTVLDASTGEKVYEETLNLRGSTYPSISLAGDRLYISSDKGATVVLQPGRTYKELARNKLEEPFRSFLCVRRQEAAPCEPRKTFIASANKSIEVSCRGWVESIPAPALYRGRCREKTAAARAGAGSA